MHFAAHSLEYHLFEQKCKHLLGLGQEETLSACNHVSSSGMTPEELYNYYHIKREKAKETLLLEKNMLKKINVLIKNMKFKEDPKKQKELSIICKKLD